MQAIEKADINWAAEDRSWRVFTEESVAGYLVEMENALAREVRWTEVEIRIDTNGIAGEACGRRARVGAHFQIATGLECVIQSSEERKIMNPG